jgi:putative ABC transport system permease protein
LMGRSISRLRGVPPGVDASNAVTFRLALPSATYPAAADVVQFVTRVLDGMASAGGVASAGAVSKVPLDDQGRNETAVFVEDRPLSPGSLPVIHPVVYASPGYFAAAGIPIVSGRSFTTLEPNRVVLEAIVSRAFANRYWPSGSAIGRRVRIYLRGPWYTIVGVAGNVRDAAIDRPADEVLYCPLLPPPEDPRWAPRDLAFVVRMSDRSFVTDSVRQVVRLLDPSIPVYRLRTLQHVVTQASARRWFTLLLIGTASVVALLLGAIGLYGVMAYVVALRTRELAIRLALGAQPGELRRMVSFQGLRMAAAGIVIGLAAAVAVTRVLATLLYEVSPTDPVVLAAASGVLLLVAAAASWLPTRRTTTIDPASALSAN